MSLRLGNLGKVGNLSGSNFRSISQVALGGDEGDGDGADVATGVRVGVGVRVRVSGGGGDEGDGRGWCGGGGGSLSFLGEVSRLGSSNLRGVSDKSLGGDHGDGVGAVTVIGVEGDAHGGGSPLYLGQMGSLGSGYLGGVGRHVGGGVSQGGQGKNNLKSHKIINQLTNSPNIKKKNTE